MSNVIRSLIVKVGADTTEFSNAMKNVSKDMNGISKDLNKTGRDLQKTGASLTKSVTLPIVAIGTAAFKVSADFEQGMSNVKALSQATGEDFDRLKEKAKEMGASTSKTATESADAMANLALAGWETNQIIEGIEPVLRLAEAGNIDLARASSLVTDSMSSMGIEVQDLGEYLDIVAQTARSSNTDIDQMAEAYVNVGGTLRGLGIPLKESAFALGAMANAGIKGSEAGRGLNAVLLNLTAPMGRAAKALGELGYSAFDGEGNFKGLETVLFDVKELTKDMDTESKNMYLSMIGGKEHIKTLNALMNGLDDSYESLTANIDEADGALMEMATVMQDNTKGDIVRLKSQLEGVGIQIGEVLIPHVSTFIEHLSGLVRKFSELSPETQEQIIKMAALAATIGPVISVAGKLTGGLGDLFRTVSGVTKGVSVFSKAIQGGSTVIGALGTALGPGGAVILGMAAFAAAAVLIYQNWDKITAAVKNAINWVKEFLGINKKADAVDYSQYDQYDYQGGGGIRPSQERIIDTSAYGATRWNAAGAIFTRPTVLPTIAGWQGFGEAGPEAVLPLSALDDMLSNKSEMKHSGTIRVKGVSNRNEFIATADYVIEDIVKNILRREVRG